MDRIVVIVGPTASGKTSLSVRLAKALDGEVISADSMQIYRCMDVGTAKVTEQEKDGVPHHMVNIVSPEEDYSAARFVEEADPILQDILSRGKTAIIAGGTGLYVDSLISGRTFAPYPATGKRQELEKEADEIGMEAMLEKLLDVDPDSAERLHVADRKRILRALEVYAETGKTITAHNQETQKIPDKYHPVWIGLDFADRQDLYSRIDRRVDLMLAQGLLAEIQGLLDTGIPQKCTAMQAIGYKELLPVLLEHTPLEPAVELLKQSSRRYAKRQLTWFRRNPNIRWIYQTDPPDSDAVFRDAISEIPFFDGEP